MTKRREKLEKRQHMKRMREADRKLTELLLKDLKQDAKMKAEALALAKKRRLAYLDR